MSEALQGLEPRHPSHQRGQVLLVYPVRVHVCVVAEQRQPARTRVVHPLDHICDHREHLH